MAAGGYSASCTCSSHSLLPCCVGGCRDVKGNVLASLTPETVGELLGGPTVGLALVVGIKVGPHTCNGWLELDDGLPAPRAFWGSSCFCRRVPLHKSTHRVMALGPSISFCDAFAQVGVALVMLTGFPMVMFPLRADLIDTVLAFTGGKVMSTTGYLTGGAACCLGAAMLIIAGCLVSCRWGAPLLQGRRCRRGGRKFLTIFLWGRWGASLSSIFRQCA